MKLMLAGCILRNNQGKILLLHRNTVKRQQWEIPGGKVEDNEEPASTAIRELKEELGIEVKIEKLLGEKDFTEGDLAMHYIWYQAKITSGHPQIMEPDIFDNMGFFTSEEMQKIILSEGARTFLTLNMAIM